MRFHSRPPLRGALSLFVAVSLLLAGCTEDPASDVLVTPAASESPAAIPSPASSVPPSASPQPSATPGPCVEQTAALLDQPEHPAELRGDVDGDGVEDAISIARNQDPDPLCATVIVVQTAVGTSALPVGEPDIPAGTGLPQLVSVRQVDGRPGAEVVVRLLAGASTEFYGLFSVRGGRLAPLEVESEGAGKDSSPRVGALVIWTGSTAPSPARSSSRWLPHRGTSTRSSAGTSASRGTCCCAPLGPPETLRVAGEQLSGLPEFIRSPFGSCPVG